MDINDHEVIKIPLSEIKECPDNPNKMTKAQLKALSKSIKKYGNFAPIIVDQNNLLADGAQRLAVYKEMGMTEIPAIRLELTDIDRRIIRQVANKLHGEHKPELDLKEYAKIIESGKLPVFAKLLAQKPGKYEKLLEQHNKNTPNLVQTVDKLGSLTVTCPGCGLKFEKGDGKQ